MLLSAAQLSVGVTKIHMVYWNSSNPIFRIDNTRHIVDVNTGNLPWEYDQLNIICPQNSLEQHVIYSVSEEEFRSCRVSNPRPKIVAICNKPEEFQYFTITFRNFSPTPGGLEFRPGQNYYLISTSTRRDLHRRVGGFCSSHNMKMIFKVADNQRASNSVESEEEEEVPTVVTTERTIASSPLLRAISSRPSQQQPTPSRPIYYYRNRSPAQQSKEFNYYYSPKDLIKLRKTIIQRTQAEENETLKAEKLRSSASSSCVLSAILLGLSLTRLANQ